MAIESEGPGMLREALQQTPSGNWEEVGQVAKMAIESGDPDMPGTVGKKMLNVHTGCGAPIRSTTMVNKIWWKLLLCVALMVWLVASEVW